MSNFFIVKPPASSKPRVQIVNSSALCSLEHLHHFLTENRATVIPPNEFKLQLDT